MILRLLAAVALLVMLSSCRSTPPPRKAHLNDPAFRGPGRVYPVAAPRKATRRLVTPVARIPIN